MAGDKWTLLFLLDAGCRRGTVKSASNPGAAAMSPPVRPVAVPRSRPTCARGGAGEGRVRGRAARPALNPGPRNLFRPVGLARGGMNSALPGGGFLRRAARGFPGALHFPKSHQIGKTSRQIAPIPTLTRFRPSSRPFRLHLRRFSLASRRFGLASGRSAIKLNLPFEKKFQPFLLQYYV